MLSETRNADMSHPALILSSDASLCEDVSQFLRVTYEFEAEVAQDRSSAQKCLSQRIPPLVFLDLREHAFILDTDDGLQRLANESEHEVRLVTIGGDYIPRPMVKLVDTLGVDGLAYPVNKQLLAESLAGLNFGRPVNGSLHTRPSRVAEADGIKVSTYTPSLFPILDQLLRVAVHDVTLLLVGETGTGKTTMAQLIHRLSRRSDEPFQNVACGALPPDLIESELFGHVRGAFTGADRSKIGRFEAAGRGTLLLDEIDVLGPKEQAKLLRVIEGGEYEPVGSTETRTSNARLIVASNVDLVTLTKEQHFRSDLYYRLNVLEFRLPPLRERPLDIVPMALEFIEDCCSRHGITVKRIHREFLDVLKRYRWPGNIRELKNQIQRAVLFCHNGDLSPNDLSNGIGSYENGAQTEVGVSQRRPWSLAERVADTEREILEEVLRANDYKRTAAAQALGISRVGLYKKMRKHGLLEKSGRQS